MLDTTRHLHLWCFYCVPCPLNTISTPFPTCTYLCLYCVLFLDFPQNTRKYSQTLFLCRIKDWPADSPFAMGYKKNNLMCSSVIVCLLLFTDLKLMFADTYDIHALYMYIGMESGISPLPISTGVVSTYSFINCL